MGGSNGGGGGIYPFSPNNAGEEYNSCISLLFRTYLASVDSVVLTTVKVGEYYDVLAETEKGPVYVAVNGARLGTILHQKDVLLLNCIFDGITYQAKIISIEEGKCQVIVSAKH